LGRLIASTVLDLVLVLLVGFGAVLAYACTVAPTPAAGLARVARAFGLPVHDDPAPVRWRYYLSLDCVAAPQGDRGLADWLRGQPGMGAVRVQRQPLRGAQGETVRISTRFVGPEGVARLDVPWQRLGYRPGTAVPEPWWTRMAPSVAFNPTDAQL